MKFLAVDFGNSSTLAAYIDSGELKFVDFGGNEYNTPTVLYFPKKQRMGEREYRIGTDAIREYMEEGEGRLLFGSKSLLGDPLFISTIIPGFGPQTASGLCGHFLRKVKLLAETQFKQKLDGVVLGRPANFPPEATAELRDAAKLAGFKKIVFIPEPIAAGIKYLSQSSKQGAETIFVFDAGGGTTDFAVLRNESKYKAEVLATGGLNLAGNALSAAITYHHLATHLGRNGTWGEKGFPVPTHYFEALKDWRRLQFLRSERVGEVLTNCSQPREFGRFVKLVSQNLGWELYQAVNQGKTVLSSNTTTLINFPQLELCIPLKLEQFERYAWSTIRDMEKEARRTLERARLTPAYISAVILTGGTSLVPAVQRIAKEIFPQSTQVLADPFSSVAGGLAIVANRLNSNKKQTAAKG
jgi:hypothetical chaperone protein